MYNTYRAAAKLSLHLHLQGWGARLTSNGEGP